MGYLLTENKGWSKRAVTKGYRPEQSVCSTSKWAIYGLVSRVSVGEWLKGTIAENNILVLKEKEHLKGTRA